jgi:hypothetical protein
MIAFFDVLLHLRLVNLVATLGEFFFTVVLFDWQITAFSNFNYCGERSSLSRRIYRKFQTAYFHSLVGCVSISVTHPQNPHLIRVSTLAQFPNQGSKYPVLDIGENLNTSNPLVAASAVAGH